MPLNGNVGGRLVQQRHSAVSNRIDHSRTEDGETLGEDGIHFMFNQCNRITTAQRLENGLIPMHRAGKEEIVDIMKYSLISSVE